jgi:hypothetical protein
VTHRHGSRVAVAALLLAAGWLSSAGIVDAQRAGRSADFSTTNTQWNGASELLEVAREQDATLEVVTRLDLGTLRPIDGLLVVHPTAELPSGPLSAFMRAGGRVALADDFGAGDALLRVFRIGRGEPNPDGPDVLRLRGNRELLVARPRAPHPLSEGVGSLVTNHPRILFHADLEPIFSIGERDAVVLAGAVGQGRLVAISDPSMLINNMLELDGNRRFASNLLLYLRGQAGGRVVLVEPGGEIVGRFGEPGADRPLHDLRVLLERAAGLELPPLALRILAVAIVAILLILVAGVLPRTSPYQASAMFRDEPVAGGLPGRVEWYRARSTDLLEPTLVLKLELEAALHARLGLAPVQSAASARVVPGEATWAALRERGLSAAELDEAKRLLDELAGLASGATNGTAPPVTDARFRNLATRSEALLRRLGPAAREGSVPPRAA